MKLNKQIDQGTLANADRERRAYIGASAIGHECLAYLQFSLRGYPKTLPTAPVLRIFELGHLIERIVVADLKEAGLHVMAVDPETMEQWEYTAFGGHLRGHADGILIEEDSTPTILEIKSMNDGKWRAFKERGIRSSHPQYMAQMQLLMGLAGVRYAYMVAYNKNNSLYHTERVTFDPDEYKTLLYRIQKVIRGGSVQRISNNLLTFDCRYCDFKPLCWKTNEPHATIPVECKTCAHAKPIGKRKWFCKAHGSRATGPCELWEPLEPTPADNE